MTTQQFDPLAGTVITTDDELKRAEEVYARICSEIGKIQEQLDDFPESFVRSTTGTLMQTADELRAAIARYKETQDENPSPSISDLCIMLKRIMRLESIDLEQDYGLGEDFRSWTISDLELLLNELNVQIRIPWERIPKKGSSQNVEATAEVAAEESEDDFLAAALHEALAAQERRVNKHSV